MTIKVYNDIDSQGNAGMFFMLGGQRNVFSAETVKDILAENKAEREFRFDINCNGGSVSEGFAIYDLIRMSGKEIHCNIDGGCHSMAVCILLAAPKQNRTANPKATALIHDVRAWAGEVTADTATALSNDLLKERNRILDVYQERTGMNRKQLETIMLEEKERTAQELLQWGFISKINKYTTNLKANGNMSVKKRTLKNLLADMTNFLKGEVLNYDFADADGNLLFSTENEDESIAVGDVASPDGTFELPDGRTVTIAKGVITEIVEPEETTVEGLQNRLETATQLLHEAQNTINNLAKTKSNYVVKPRTGTGGKAKQTAEDRKSAVRAGLKKGGQ